MSYLERALVRWLNSDRWRTYSKSAQVSNLRNSRAFERLDLARRYLLSSYHSTRDRSRYLHVRTVCLEIGHMKSGGTMLGALLDAHPRVAFADETDAVRYFGAGFRREQVCYLLEKGARREAMKGRVTARRLEPYSFEIPGQWQGQTIGLDVVGDSKAGITTQRLGADPGLVSRIQDRLDGTELKFFHVVRNPFDPISVMMMRGKRTFDDAVERYFTNCAILSELRARLPTDSVHVVRYEDMVDDPEGQLRAACDFLGIEANCEYLAACAAIVAERPPERTRVEWTERRIERVSAEMTKYPFLTGYAFENPRLAT
jgi:hypothetical protein